MKIVVIEDALDVFEIVSLKPKHALARCEHSECSHW